MKKTTKQWLVALGLLLLGVTHWGCKNIDLFPNRYVDPEEKYIKVKISKISFCSSEYLYYMAYIDESVKIKNYSISKYIQKYGNRIILEERQELKDLGLVLGSNPNKNSVKKKIKFKNLRKYVFSLSERNRVCSIKYDEDVENFPYATLIYMK